MASASQKKKTQAPIAYAFQLFRQLEAEARTRARSLAAIPEKRVQLTQQKIARTLRGLGFATSEEVDRLQMKIESRLTALERHIANESDGKPVLSSRPSSSKRPAPAKITRGNA